MLVDQKGLGKPPVFSGREEDFYVWAKKVENYVSNVFPKANCVSRYKLMDDGRTPDQRRCGKTWKRPVVEFGESVHFRPVGENNALPGGDLRLLRGVFVGHHERSGAAISLTPDGVKRETGIARMLEHERWDRVFSATCIGVPWQ